MTRYAADSRDRVFDAVDVVALISARSDLRRTGPNSYVGNCPFHDERTGSFHVSPDEKLYHCFGCQAGGDPFKFVMETEGLDFKGSLEFLANRFGVALETEDEDPAAAARRHRRERLYTLLGRATAYYSRYLWDAGEAEPARRYLLARGLSEETLREFRVGYAPSTWDRILKASRSAGFSEEELLAAGLAQRSKAREGAIYDRFRERIIFPSVDTKGRVLGFGARAMRENQPPKYLNTSDGEIYHKRSQLFGIDLARATAAKAGRMILVEGYTDVLAFHQAGLRNAVGIMGTALTEEQVRELERIVAVLELCLDADRAGQQAMLRAAQIAEGRDLELRVVPLPVGADPGELIGTEGGAERLRALVESSVPFVVFHVERILERSELDSAEGRDRAFAELRPVLSGLPASSLRDELMRSVAGRLELGPAQLERLFEGAAPAVPGPGSGGSPRPVTPTTPILEGGLRAERAFLALCISLPQAGAETLSAIDADVLLTSSIYRRAARHLATRTDVPLSELPADDDELARVIADLVDRSGRGGHVSEEQLDHARLVLELARIDRAVIRTRATGAPGVGALAHEREHVRSKLHGVLARMERAI